MLRQKLSTTAYLFSKLLLTPQRTFPFTYPSVKVWDLSFHLSFSLHANLLFMLSQRFFPFRFPSYSLFFAAVFFVRDG